MYESYTRQALPPKEYRELLGSALCVFSSNNAFVIENILHTDNHRNWYALLDKTSGRLKDDINETISTKCGNTEICELFSEVVEMRNRIIHGFQVTHDNEQILATKTLKKDGNEQFIITKEYLYDFLRKNQRLSDLLYEYRKQNH